MALIKCFDCGASISESARQCPKCGSYNVKGVQCVICGKRMKASESAMRHTTQRHTHMHNRCGASLFDNRGHCRECGRTIWGGWGSDWVSDLMHIFLSISAESQSGDSYSGPKGGSHPCRKCGVLDPLSYRGICTSCGLPIFGQLHEVSTIGTQHRQCEDGWRSHSG
jgi:hypothetical protein